MSFQSKEWILTGNSGLDDLRTRVVSKPPLGSFDVLVRMKALSLNHRDVVLALVIFPSDFISEVIVQANSPARDYILCPGPKMSLRDQTVPAR